MKRAILLAIALIVTPLASANTWTLEFSASGFQNAGTQYPGYSGPISGMISWDSTSLSDPIMNLTYIALTIYGHTYTLADTGVANNGSSQTAIGGSAHGFNAVVGDGQFDDFLLVFDRVNPSISAFAYGIAGLSNAIWWTPTTSEAHFVTASVPEPGTALLLVSALMVAGFLRRDRRSRG